MERPYRLWDATEGKFERWRCFKHKQNAHNAALIEARWAKISGSIDVIDIRIWHCLGTYTRKVYTIQFTGSDSKRGVEVHMLANGGV